MSSPKEVIGSPCDTQETCYEDGSLKVNNETQRASLNESQDFHLLVESDDESMVKETQDGEAQQLETPEALQSEVDDNATTRNDREDETVTNEKAMEDQAAEKTEGNVSGESQKKDEPSDEDEVIQGTPPQSYSPSRKMRSVDVASLKRKARTVDEDQIAAKVARTTSTDDATKVEGQLEEEESRQSCESDDSYQDLFKNIDKNVIIEETQDPTNVEFTQNSLQIPTEQVAKLADDDKAQKRHTDQQGEEFPEKYSQSEEKDENLNVSAKLADSSANDSMFVMNSTNESDSQLEDNSPSVETKGDVSSTSVVIADEKSGIGTLSETESVRDTETVADENNRVEQSNCTKKKADDNDGTISSSQTKSRFSVELIYEGANRAVADNESRPKPHVVQIDDDGEMSILDSSAEVTYASQGTRPEVVQIDDSHEYVERIVLDSLGKDAEIHTVDKSSYESKSSHMSLESMKETSLDSKLTPETNLVNGSAESKKSDTETTTSLDSDTFIGCDDLIPPVVLTTHEILKLRPNRDLSMPKDDNVELISISDHETSNVEEKSKSSLMYNNTKTMQVEREIHVWLKLKCLMHVDENTKEPVSKELTAVQCEPVVIDSVSRQKNDDSQSSLADISGNKDSSPGSINSNTQLYQLNPSRLSILSSISSSSSASSAASLAFKLQKHKFPMPVGPAKHAKKSSQEALSTAPDKQTPDETYHRLTHEWKNHRLLTTTILNHANAELGTTATAAAATTIVDTFANVSNEPLDDHHHLEENNMRSSTPSDQPMTSMEMELAVTPKNTKKNKAVKRPRSKMTKSDAAQINGENEPTRRTAASETDTPSSRKKIKTEDTEDKLRMSDMDVLANSSPQNVLDELIGKNVFAKWADNNYYPGTVIDRLKTKYKVKFYDGQSKTLIPEFVIPAPKILRNGLSICATTNINDYGSYAVIIDFDTSSTYYTVETDEHKRLCVQLENISLTVDQAKVLKEEMDSASKVALLSTPKTLGQVTLDNMVDGKRRSKRIGTPLFSTPKSRSNAAGTSTPASKIKAEPSVSGMSAKLKREKGALSENEGVSSDSNVELVQTGDEWYVLRGVQKEINGTPYEQIVKGPQSRIKGKSRSKKKAEDDLQMIQDLGPIPSNSIFKGMSFILTCAVLKKLDRYPKDTKVSTASETETDASETDFETENEDGWVDQAFVRERLHAQILAGGGKLYEDFGEIPKDEYKNTILISNVPNTTAKTILCLSVGIRVCNHKWVSSSCNEGKAVSTAEYALPNGWSLQKKTYIEAYETSKSKPLSEIVVIIPSLAYDGEYAIFWQQVCENAGAIVVIVEDSGAMDKIDFVDDYSNVVIISNRKCPLWATDRAARLQIPVLSTTWVVQCIIEGQLCPRNENPCYRYNYILN